MKKNVEKSTTFRADVKNAKVEIKTALNNIFHGQKELRALAKKNDFCDGKSVAIVAKAIRNYTGGGSLFDLSALPVDSFGRFCIVKHSKVMPVWGFDVVNVSNGYDYLTPYCTTTQLFSYFCKIAAKEIKAIEKAEYEYMCAEERERKEIEKKAAIRVRKLNAITAEYQKGKIDRITFETKKAALAA